jgi:hypothetical protein
MRRGRKYVEYTNVSLNHVLHVAKFRIHGGFPPAIWQAFVTPSAANGAKETTTMAGSLMGSTNQANFNEGLSLPRPVTMLSVSKGYPSRGLIMAMAHGDSYACVAQWWSPKASSLAGFIHTVLSPQFESRLIRSMDQGGYKNAAFDCKAVTSWSHYCRLDVVTTCTRNNWPVTVRKK